MSSLGDFENKSVYPHFSANTGGLKHSTSTNRRGEEGTTGAACDFRRVEPSETSAALRLFLIFEKFQDALELEELPTDDRLPRLNPAERRGASGGLYCGSC